MLEPFFIEYRTNTAHLKLDIYGRFQLITLIKPFNILDGKICHYRLEGLKSILKYSDYEQKSRKITDKILYLFGSRIYPIIELEFYCDDLIFYIKANL